MTLDIDCFEQLCKTGESLAEDTPEKLEAYLGALRYYSGDFLPRFSTESWVIPSSAYYHNLYTQALDYTLPRLTADKRYGETIALCRTATEVEPYNEVFCRHLMTALIETGNPREAVAVYNNLSELLSNDFGVMPSAETRELHRKIMRTVNDNTLSIFSLQEQLREPETGRGAFFCEYDFFKTLYQSKARGISRSGECLHLCMFTANALSGDPLPRRSLDRCMENLQLIICSSLRKCDMVSRCSINQFAVLLPQANYENSCMVCDRITRAFFRQYPHSPAAITCSVQPVVPFE